MGVLLGRRGGPWDYGAMVRSGESREDLSLGTRNVHLPVCILLLHVDNGQIESAQV